MVIGLLLVVVVIVVPVVNPHANKAWRAYQKDWLGTDS